MRLLGVALFALLGALVVGAPRAVAEGGPSGAETLSVTIPPSGSLTCALGGKALHPNATVHRGDHLHCTATGFAANETVTVAVHSPVRTLGHVTASGSGKVVYEYSVAEDMAAGSHSLSFTGRRSATVAIFPFVVAVGAGSTGGGGSGGSGGGGGIAFTGINVLGLLTIAVALIGAGVALHRRRLERERV